MVIIMDILIKLFALSIIVTILPITSEVFGISLISIHQRFLLIFPAIGLIISLCSLFLLLGEAKRIRAVNDAKYRINRQYMDEKYQYMFFNRLVGTSSDNKRKWMSSETTWIVFSLQLIIIAAVCVVMLYPN